MEGVSWSSTRAQESFSRSAGASNTLSRLASFIARADTKQHSRSQRSPQPHLPLFACQECDEGFSYGADLLDHQQLKHTLPKPHRCASCGLEFSLRSSLQLHECEHQPSPCQLCHGGSQPGSLCVACTSCASEPGQPGIVDSGPYTCALCGRGFGHKQALLHHQQAGCSEPPSPSDAADARSLPDHSPPVSDGDSSSDSSEAPGPSSRGVSVCQHCSRSFRTEDGLLRHQHISHAQERLAAPHGLKTKGEGTGGDWRKRGSTRVHGDPGKGITSTKKLLNCRSCDMVFSNTSKLYLHRKDKHSREKTIEQPTPLKKKRRKVMAYPCQVCGKVFLHHLSLRAHFRHLHGSNFTAIKSEEPPVEQITKDLTLSVNRPKKVKTRRAGNNKTVKAVRGRPRKVLRSTKVRDLRPGTALSEVEDRDFPCPSCAQVFSVQSELKEHVELHQSSVKTLQCSVCTSQMDSAKGPGSKRHRLYHCVPCQQGFSLLDSFLEHCQQHLRVRVEEDSVAEGYTHQASKA